MRPIYLLIFIALILLVVPASAWLTGYNYRTAHYINGSDSGAQTYYQVMLNVSNTSGASSGDLLYTQGHNLNFPNDLRFTDTSDTQWDYWIESNNTTYATVWIEVPSVPSGSTSQVEMYCYYGNATTTDASNGTNTFPLLFEHFDGVSLNTSKWSLISGSVSISSSICDVYDTATDTYLNSISSFPVNTSMRYNALIDRNSTKNVIRIRYDSGNYCGFTGTGIQYRALSVKNSLLTETYLGAGYTGYHLWDLVRNASTSNIFLIDNSLITTHTSNVFTNSGGVGISSLSKNHTYIDYVFTRGYVYPEPAHSTFTAEGTAPCTADFTGTPLFGIAPLDVQFTDSTTTTAGTIVNWSWQFGDGGTSFSQNPLYTYVGIGTYWVNLTVTNSLGSTNSLNRTAYISTELPVANFTGTPTYGYVPLSVQFNDTTSNTPTSWNWSFGDGTYSNVQNASHIYTHSGLYTVALNATNGVGSDTETKVDYINVSVMPNVIFSGIPLSGNTPLTVSFTDSSTTAEGTIDTWDWMFGDGSPNSTTQNPTHTYTTSGLYSVSLTITNSFGISNTTTYTNYISASTPGSPTANFHGTPTSGTVPLTVTFFDDSTGSPTSWNWSFGDGQFSTLQNPVHTYSVVGLYTVSLNATNVFGSDVAQANDYIAVTAAPTPTQTPSNATGGTRGYSAEETAIPFWLWAVIIILGSALLIAGLFGRHLIFGIMSTMCFAAAAFASPMVSFFYQEVVLSNESEVAYSVFPMKWLVTQPWVAWLLWGMALLALLVVVYGVIVGMAEIKKPGDEFLEDDWLDKRDF